MNRRAAVAILVLGTLTACGRSGGEGDTAPTTPPTSVTAVTTTTTPVAVPSYVVQPGDSLSGLAQRFGVTVDELAQLNGITDVDSITAGDSLAIPRSTSTTAPPDADIDGSGDDGDSGGAAAGDGGGEEAG